MSPADAAPRLIIARHGETEYNRKLLCQGWLDAPLNETGQMQAKRLAERLGDDPVARVAASPLKRTRQTAEAVANRHGLDVETHEGLKEIHHGDLEGLPFMELDDHIPGIRESWRVRPDTVQMPNGECLADVQARAWPAFEEVTRRHVLAMRDGGPYGRMVPDLTVVLDGGQVGCLAGPVLPGGPATLVAVTEVAATPTVPRCACSCTRTPDDRGGTSAVRRVWRVCTSHGRRDLNPQPPVLETGALPD